jgi:hypothetical protein
LGLPPAVRWQFPCEVDIERNTTLAGSGSFTLTPVVVCPPVLVALIV